MRLQPGVYFCVLVTSVSLRSWSANLLSFLDLSLIRRAGILETLLIFWRRLQHQEKHYCLFQIIYALKGYKDTKRRKAHKRQVQKTICVNKTPHA